MIRKAVMLLIGLVFLVSPIDAKGPVVINNVDCTMPASDWSIFNDGSVIMTQGKAVYINENNGISKFTCKATQPVEIPYPSKAVHFDYANTNIACATPFGETTDWMAVITPSGQAMMTCRINPSTAP